MRYIIPEGLFDKLEEYFVPVEVKKAFQRLCPEIIAEVANHAKRLAPDTEREIYGWQTGTSIELVYNEGNNIREEQEPPKLKVLQPPPELSENPLEARVQEFAQNSLAQIGSAKSVLEEMIGDKEKQEKIMELLGEKKGTPFGAFIACSDRVGSSREKYSGRVLMLWDNETEMLYRYGAIVPFVSMLRSPQSRTAKLTVCFHHFCGYDPTDPYVTGEIDLETLTVEIKRLEISEYYKLP